MTREPYWIEASDAESALELVDWLALRGVRGVALATGGDWYVRIVGRGDEAGSWQEAHRVTVVRAGRAQRARSRPTPPGVPASAA